MSPCPQKDLDLSAHTVLGALSLWPLDYSSVLGIVEEVSNNPHGHKTSWVTEMLTPQSESLRPWGLTWLLSWTRNDFFLLMESIGLQSGK